jgi:hypothetical protein
LTGAGIAVAGGVLAAGGEAGAGGVDISAGVEIAVDVGERETAASLELGSPAGTPVLLAAPAVVSAGGLSARDAGGSDLLKTEHAASTGIRASTRSTRIEPPLTLAAFTCALARVVPDGRTLVAEILSAQRRRARCQPYTSSRDRFGRTSGSDRRREPQRIVAVSAIDVSVELSLAR